MPSKSFPLDVGGPDRVEATWEGAFKSLRVSFDGAAVAAFASEKDVEAPRKVALPDGSELEVQVAKYGFLPELRLSRDGVPLPGSSGDPRTQLAAATNVLYAIAGLNAIIGIIAVLFDVASLKALGAGWGSLVSVAIYAGLGWLVAQRSATALWAAMALFILDGAFTFVLAARAGASPPVGGIIMRVFLLMPMFRATGAIRELNAPPRPRPKRPRPAAGAAGSATIAPGSSSPAAEPRSLPPAPAAKVLAGDAERKRLALTERQGPSGPTSVVGRRIETKGPAGVDAAKKSLRFIAHKVEFGETGFRVTEANGAAREVPFADVARVSARQLPPDPPWDAAMFVDILPKAGDPVRIFGTTTVNYAALGGGSTSRLENTRKLVGFLRDRAPGAALDDATRAFAEGPRVPQKFANMTQFLEYDAGLDAPSA